MPVAVRLLNTTWCKLCIHEVCVCVCACARMCVRVCDCRSVCVPRCVCVCVCVEGGYCLNCCAWYLIVFNYITFVGGVVFVVSFS